MADTLPEALRLADWIDNDIPPLDETVVRQAAAELRRLSRVEVEYNDSMRQLLTERDRLAAELERVKSDQQSRFCPECEARGKAQPAARGMEPDAVWEASSKTANMLFATEEDALRWLSQFAPSVSGGFEVCQRTVYRVPGITSSKEPAATPEAAKGDERG